MDNYKTQMVAFFRELLQNRDIRFEEKANGHFQIFDTDTGKLVYQAWATTNKMINNPANKIETYTWEGINPIKRELDRWLTEKANIQLKGEEVTLTYGQSLKRLFIEKYEENKGHAWDLTLVVGVYLPTGATEIITNSQDIESKMEYYIDAYDDEFHLKTNPKVKITGFMLV